MERERCASSTIRFSWKARTADVPISHSVGVPGVNLFIGGRFGFADPTILPKRGFESIKAQTARSEARSSLTQNGIPVNSLNAYLGQKSADMELKHGRIPPGPQEKYRVTDDLLDWMSRQFRIFGDIYKASVYGASVYAIRDVEFAHHVLVEN